MARARKNAATVTAPRPEKTAVTDEFGLIWVLTDPLYETWETKLASGMIELTVWNGRINPILWRYFDGFRSQITGRETIDIELPSVDATEAKRLAVIHVAALFHQIGAELGLWEKKVEIMGVGANTIRFTVK